MVHSFPQPRRGFDVPGCRPRVQNFQTVPSLFISFSLIFVLTEKFRDYGHAFDVGGSKENASINLKMEQISQKEGQNKEKRAPPVSCDVKLNRSNVRTDLDTEQLKHFDELLEGATERYKIPRRVSKTIVRVCSQMAFKRSLQNIIRSEESSTLLKVAAGIADPSELPAQKFTRSKTMLNVPLRPVEVASLANRPPNFLYVKDFGNDDGKYIFFSTQMCIDDVDYVEDQSDEGSRSSSSSEECLEEENDEDEVEKELKGLAEDGDDFFDNMQNWNSWVYLSWFLEKIRKI